MKQANAKLVKHIDCPGGGQVWVDGTTMYIGHMRSPAGTTIVDVADPTAPRILASIEARPGWHSHKVRVANDIMIINQESVGGPDGQGGIDIHDVAVPANPKLLSHYFSMTVSLGLWHEDATPAGQSLQIGSRNIPFFDEPDIRRLTLDGVDVVLECTGQPYTREYASRGLQAGASRMLISGPARGRRSHDDYRRE